MPIPNTKSEPAGVTTLWDFLSEALTRDWSVEAPLEAVIDWLERAPA